MRTGVSDHLTHQQSDQGFCCAQRTIGRCMGRTDAFSGEIWGAVNFKQAGNRKKRILVNMAKKLSGAPYLPYVFGQTGLSKHCRPR